MQIHSTDWHPDKEARLVHLWEEEKKSQGDIAKLLGVTRNAVAGKIARLGLHERRPNQYVNKWTDAMRERVREYHALGMALARSADRINAEFGTRTTKHSIRKIERSLKLAPRLPSNQFTAGTATFRRKQKSDVKKIASGAKKLRLGQYSTPSVFLKLFKFRVIKDDIPVEQRKTLFELEARHCRWPIGDPDKPDFFFCGADKIDGSSYCCMHHERTHAQVA